MSDLPNPLEHPVCLAEPRRLTSVSAWKAHIPFGMYLVDLVRPQVLVELGTHKGDSYCAFCQAVDELGLRTRCYAVDTWEGDPHSGFYGPEVLDNLRGHHDPLYGNFSTLIQSKFEDALDHFDDGEIDFLHIDGYHTYDAVKKSFDSWLPKVGDHGLILLHDIDVRERDFGVRKLWEEIKSDYQHFEMLHQHGLGLLVVGEVNSSELQKLVQLKGKDLNTIREFFFRLGKRLTLTQRIIDLEKQIDELSGLEDKLERSQGDVNRLEEKLEKRKRDIEQLREELKQSKEENQQLNEELAQSQGYMQRLEEEVSGLFRDLETSKKTISRLEEEKKSLKTEVETREEDINEIRKSNNKLEAKLEEVKKNHESLRENYKLQKAAKENFQAKLKKAETKIDDLESRISTFRSESARLQTEIATMRSSLGWRLLERLRRTSLRLFPRETLRGKLFWSIPRGLKLWSGQGFRVLFSKVKLKIRQKLADKTSIDVRFESKDERESRNRWQELLNPDSPPPIKRHDEKVDIIICVHNALADVKKTLRTVLRYTTGPYEIILVDDGSDEPTRDYLKDFSDVHDAVLIRNKEAQGYTKAANMGLKKSSSQYALLLNSDVEVTPGWLDRLVTCAESDSNIGMVGPLSNAASWQSIPRIEDDGDFANNDLPDDWDVKRMGRAVALYSGRFYPRLPFLNGFCNLIKRELIDEIGYFDEGNFGEGYGQENDYCLRASEAGWELALADDTYIWHSQSKSYSHEKRKELTEKGDNALLSKWDGLEIKDKVEDCHHGLEMEGIRARAGVLAGREKHISRGKEAWEGKRVLFVLPIAAVGGGGNVVFQEARPMIEMGVDVQIVNLEAHRDSFERQHPELTIPVNYISSKERVGDLASDFDAVVATVNTSVSWLSYLSEKESSIVKGYYIQDYEPRFYEKGSEGHKIAKNSYDLFPDLVRFTKTRWNANILDERLSLNASVVGPSVDIDLFRPKKVNSKSWPKRPLRICAMVRPSSPRRGPELTMEVLKEVYNRYGNDIEVVILGVDADDKDLHELPTDFQFTNLGVLDRNKVATLFEQIDIFVDFSHYQAMGLTAMEAMSAGAAVIVPSEGGAESFARRGYNSLFVETVDKKSCIDGLTKLIENHNFRKELRRQAVYDIVDFYPEKVAVEILRVLFGK